MSFLRRLFNNRTSKPYAKRYRPSLDSLEERTVPTAGNGLQFNITSGTGAAQPSAQIMAGFQQAAKIWSSILSDDVTINVRVDMSASIPLGGEANTAWSGKVKSLTEIRDALTADRTSQSDNIAVAHLPAGSSAAIYETQFGTGAPLFDNNGTDNNTYFIVTRANLKAMGLLAPDDPTLDGVIQFTTANVWDFDASDGISANKYDYFRSAVHEIGHLLGFTSGASTVDLRSKPNGPGYNSTIDQDNNILALPLDLFRDSAASVSAGANFDLRADKADKYFSIDGGVTPLGSFATGIFNGDGSQPSHWKNNAPGALSIGVMDPGGPAGEALSNITRIDAQALDVIGWNLAMDSGDAPDTGPGVSAGNYQTTTADNGPRHVMFSPSGSNSDPAGAPKVYLGAGVGSDLNGKPNATATGDNDDGVASFPTLGVGTTTYVSVKSSASVAHPAKLNYFVDFNQNGVFDDPGESFAVTLTSATQLVPVVVPAGATLGGSFARLRISTAGNLGPNGPADDGEVEDYAVTLAAVHAPIVANVSTLEGALSPPIVVTAVPGDAVMSFKISNIVGGALFQNDGTTPIANGAFITAAQAQAGVRFRPPFAGAGFGQFDVESSQDGVTVAPQSGKSTGIVTVNGASKLQVAGDLGGCALAVTVDINAGVYTGAGTLTAPNGQYYNLSVKSGTRQGSVVHLLGKISPPGSSTQIDFSLDVDLATGLVKLSYLGAKGLPVVLTTSGSVAVS